MALSRTFMAGGRIRQNLCGAVARVLMLALLLLGSMANLGLAQEPGHWAYRPVAQQAVPQRSAAQATWPQRNAIDAWVQAKLLEAGKLPGEEADAATLLRRVTLDLTGLVPTLQEQADFLKDRSPDALERVIDRLLASPQSAERMATPWLDLARYADTHGYHSDSERQMWRYRDWVLDALADGMPYDQFTREQLAGDLLPGATLSKKIATGLQRNHLLNDENGAIAEEFLNEYVADRVATFGTIWLGQTLACARCHDHKYDPLSQKQYYQLYAFFHNVPENGIGGRHGNSPPWIVSPTKSDEERLVAWEKKLAGLREKLMAERAALLTKLPMWEQSLQQAALQKTAPPSDATRTLTFDAAVAEVHYSREPQFVPGKVGKAFLGDGETWIRLPSERWERTSELTLSAWIFATTNDAQVILSQADETLEGRGLMWRLEKGRMVFALTHTKGSDELVVQTKEPLSQRKWHHLAVVYDGKSRGDSVKLLVDGNEVAIEVVSDTLKSHVLTDALLKIGQTDEQASFRGLLDEVQLFSRSLSSAEVALLAGVDPYATLLKVDAANRTPQQQQEIEALYLQQQPAFQSLATQVQGLEAKIREVNSNAPTTMVMEELAQPRATFVLERGEYNKPKEQVFASAPTQWGSWEEQWPLNRLGLVDWVLEENNPLTARVTANRQWQLLWGAGLVRTADDFGTRGEKPTHPELLDYLASELTTHQWDTRYLVRKIVSSHTYRQSSQRNIEQQLSDPENRLLMVGPRYRLPAEMIRDVALQTSGLLVEQLGGAPVRPYQPGDLWKDLAYDPLNYGAQSFAPSQGAGLYRRSLYTFWKRTVPPQGLALLDAPDREMCTAARPITNTPLQALLLLNDVTYVEASRKLAERVMGYVPTPPAKHFLPTPLAIARKRLDLLYRIVLGRAITDQEAEVLLRQIALDEAEFDSFPGDAEKLLSVGKSSVSRQHRAAELAAWTLAVSVILNLDEAVTQH